MLRACDGRAGSSREASGWHSELLGSPTRVPAAGKRLLSACVKRAAGGSELKGKAPSKAELF